MTTSDRFWETCVLQVFRKLKKSYEASDEDLRMVGALFERAKGSWEGLSAGNNNDWDLLRRCAKVYMKRKLKKESDGT